MNRRDKAKLHMLDGLDSEIIERNSEKRARLKEQAHRRRQKKWISWLSAAASFVIVLSATLLIWKYGSDRPVDPIVTPPGEKQIPVYEGMSIRSEEDVRTLMADAQTPIYLFSGNASIRGDRYDADRDGKIDQKNPFGKDEGNRILDAAKDSLQIVGADRELYYAKPNEDIYFVIHINNPDNFEILSFTLNGKVYSSYMFEEGSDMETLILKYNVGDVEGIREYTIDAIKYIDGTEIKDVRMEGERTVRAGIYSEDKQPTPAITAEDISFHGLSFKVNVTDQMNLIGGSEGKLYAVLYDGETIVKQTELKVGEETTVTFDGLTSGKLYEYAIIGVYDAFDGAEVTAHTLTSKAFYTESVVSFDEINVSDNKISYVLKWSDNAQNKTLKTLTLIQGETQTELDVNTTEIALLSDTEYTLTATYETNGTTESIEIGFRTVARIKPTVELGAVTQTADGVSFVLNETDESNIGTMTKVEIFKGDELVKTVTGDVREVSGMFSGLYTLKITYSYDINDGNGVQTIVIEKEICLESRGLEITDGVITGMGTCTDQVLFLNHPIAVYAFQKIEYDENGVGTWVSNDAIQAVVCGDGVTSIGSGAFYDCSTMRSIELSSTLTEIKDGAFANCRSLTSVTIPKSVKTVGNTIFRGCNKLVEVINLSSCTMTSESLGVEMSTGYYIDVHNGKSKLVNENGYVFYRQSLIDYVGTDTQLTLPDSYNGESYSIYPYAFYKRSDIQGVTIPNSITSIGDCAFYDCSGLPSVTIPNSVTSIGKYAFRGCNALTSLTIPDSVTSIGQAAFVVCSNLTSVVIGNGVTSIGSIAFFNCTALASVMFENTEGWMAGETALSAADLANPSTAATYLNSTYRMKAWTRS